jgi:hypothetical protein
MADTMDQAVQNIQGQLGLGGLTTDETKFIQEELAADKARQAGGGIQVPWQAFSGGKFMDFGPNEFHAVLTQAEQFAANTDFRLMPTQQQMQDAVTQGVSLSDTRAFEQYMMQYVPQDVQTKMPWLGSGLGKTSYDSTLQSYKATWERMTGSVADETDPNWLSHVSGLIGQGIGVAQYENQVKTDPAMQDKFGWLKHGMDYTTFQQYKQDPNNRQLAVARFGADGASQDQSYLTALDTATIAPTKAGAINPQSQRQTTNLQGQSSVR